MDLKGKTGAQLDELRAAKAKELHEIFEARTVEVDGVKGYDMTVDQLADVRARNAELEDIGKARDAQLEQERIAASAKALHEEMSAPRRLPFITGKGGAAAAPARSLGAQFVESKQFRNYLANKPQESDTVELEGVNLKTLMTTTTGWVPETTRSGLVVPYATRPIQVTDIIPQISTTQNAYVYMEETTFTNAAVETAEGGSKPEAALALTERTSPVRKIAVWIPVTDEQLDDVPGIQSYIEQRLSFMVAQRLDSQILVGTGVGVNLLGILNVVGVQTQAKGADPTPDAVYKAMTKVRVTGRAIPGAFVTHPNDWQDVRLLRTVDGIYIWGSPSDVGPERIWGLPVVITDAITEGTGLVGDFNNFSLLVERMGMTIKVGFPNDDFLKNQRSIVAEIRVALAITRPTAFSTVTGI